MNLGGGDSIDGRIIVAGALTTGILLLAVGIGGLPSGGCPGPPCVKQFVYVSHSYEAVDCLNVACDAPYPPNVQAYGQPLAKSTGSGKSKLRLRLHHGRLRLPRFVRRPLRRVFYHVPFFGRLFRWR